MPSIPFLYETEIRFNENSETFKLENYVGYNHSEGDEVISPE